MGENYLLFFKKGYLIRERLYHKKRFLIFLFIDVIIFDKGKRRSDE